MNIESVFFLNLEIFFFCKIGTRDLFPIKKREKPNLNRRKQRSNGEVIGGQSWLIGGQCPKVEDDSNVMSFGAQCRRHDDVSAMSAK